MGLFSSTEEKLFNGINKLEEGKELNKELYNAFFKYERPRQTWKFSERETKAGNLLKKIEQGQFIGDKDLNEVKDVIKKSCGEDDKYIFPYTNSLELIKQLDEQLKSNNVSQKDKKEYQEQKKQHVEDITNFFYGKGNFMQELAKEYWGKNDKSLFDLLSKYKKEKYADMLRKKKQSNSEFDEILSKHHDKLAALSGLVTEAFGQQNQYGKKLEELLNLYMDVITG